MDPAPKSADAVRAELRRLRARDVRFASGRILGSMCTTPHPIAREAYDLFLETNLGDPWLNEGAKEVEDRALAEILSLLHGPEGAGAAFTSGGSEANFTALLIARTLTGRSEVVLPESAHFSFEKACFYLGLTPRFVPTRADGTADVEAMRAAANPRTAAIVGIAGSTELGVIDDIAGLAGVARDVGAYFHVDAALGGFVIPFAKDLGRKIPDFDFDVDGVSSIAVDPHKMGLAPIPAGVLTVADRAHLTAIAVRSPYVSIERQPTLQGTRSGAAAAATWAVMTHLGREGYRGIVAECLAVTDHLADGLAAAGAPPVRRPMLNIVAFAPRDPGLLRRLLADEGYLLGLAPKSRGLKIVAMPHVTRTAADAFLRVLPRALGKANAAPQASIDRAGEDA
ncbi:MAG: tyrosine decarboxylase MfnA [Thermoplasmatota archaeon]